MTNPIAKMLDDPRIPAQEPEDWDEEVMALLGRAGDPAKAYNIAKTLAHHPKLLKRWNPLIMHTLRKSTLPPRARELIILRTSWQGDCHYEWHQHEGMAQEAGLSEDDLVRVEEGPQASGWDDADRVLMTAVDELKNYTVISDNTWAVLEQHYERQQIMDIVATVGAYLMLAMALNTFGVQVEEPAD